MVNSVGELVTTESLFECYRSRLTAAIGRRMDPRVVRRIDAEAIVNRAIGDAIRRWDAEQAERHSSRYAWLYRIALDCLIEEHRRETRQKRDVLRDLPIPDSSSLLIGRNFAASQTSPSQHVANQEQNEHIHQVMDLMPDPDKEILLMRHFDDLTWSEIGEILDISEDAARKRCTAAIVRLKRLWEKTHGPVSN